MQIIPVLDIRRGQVVHARQGMREHYQPIQSVLTTRTDPVQVLHDILNWHAFPVVYIADLDSIEQGYLDTSLYQKIIDHFPQLKIWLDIGVRTQSDMKKLASFSSISAVIGSETLMDVSVLQDLDLRKKAILSLDKKGNELLGEIDLFNYPQFWPEQVIAMQLDNIGSDMGPAYDWIAEIKKANCKVKIYAAGGVRNSADLMELKQRGVVGCLLASALHNGKIERGMITSYK